METRRRSLLICLCCLNGKASLTALVSGKPHAQNQTCAESDMHRIKRNVQYVLLGGVVFLERASAAQEFLPSPPPDRALVYILDDQNKLVALPFEKGQTPLHPEKVAGSTKISYVELKGEHSATTVTTTTPRWFLFTFERPGAH